MPPILRSTLDEISLELTLTLPRSKRDTFDMIYQDDEFIYFIPVRENVVHFIARAPRGGLSDGSLFKFDPFKKIPDIIEHHNIWYEKILNNHPLFVQTPFLRSVAQKKYHEDLVLTFFTAEKGELAVSFDTYDNFPKKIEFPIDTIALELPRYREQLKFLKETIPMDAVPKILADNVMIDTMGSTLSLTDWLVFSLLDGKKTVKQLTERSGIGTRETLSVLLRLKEAGFIEV
ncbi:hypothetical protein GM182_02715 [bacterium 3DAC]|jgi:hypothetical protein|nr:hypothetical protein [Dictyoglomota bacterium]UZN22837.1 hypothetical protein GM182_02715 [bacterium 3DAC]